MRESAIEQYLRDKVKAAGGTAYKWTSPGNSGVPDRIVIMPGGRIRFVELKAPGGKPTKLQLAQHRRLSALGCDVLIIDSREKVNDFIAEVSL
ncbi:VRR-NUC domain-containing protein [Paenibacillus pasadenensis]|uniref:VRR-NUC domain-containing protein n=1 Tax=Paenibacillus pasadenensis TaxID=217090 RepID=UPI00203E4304|nr:VRR-NUC domain-containing protein [Paenibacillus pasadenensis]MCM3747436.1 VRR-NUC domain-containing protein [Paenibacillus pasadenensis]